MRTFSEAVTLRTCAPLTEPPENQRIEVRMAQRCAKFTELGNWFHEYRAALPTAPFTLRAGIRVSDPSRFYMTLEADIQAGRTAIISDVERPRQRWLPLLQDLEDLRIVVESRV